jgi:hypothetical protein
VTASSLIAVVRFIGPPQGFYETAATVIAALSIAVAVELRLMRPRRFQLSEDPEQRRWEIRDAIFLMVWPLASLVGLMAAFWALSDGGNRLTGNLTGAGLAAAVLCFYGLSMSLFLRIIGQALPWSKRTRGILAIVGGMILIGTGIALTVAGQ